MISTPGPPGSHGPGLGTVTVTTGAEAPSCATRLMVP
jgi:hypothetical protein